MSLLNQAHANSTTVEEIALTNIVESLPRHDLQPVRKLEFPIFDGTNPDAWLFRVERYFTLKRLSESEKLEVAAMAMEGRALAWFQFVDASKKFRSWEGFKEIFLSRFRPRHEGTLCEHFLAMRQLTTVEEFIRKFETVVSLLQGKMTDEVLESAFLNGLKPTLRAELRMLRPKGLKEMMELAQMMEDKHRLLLRNRHECGDIEENYQADLSVEEKNHGMRHFRDKDIMSLNWQERTPAHNGYIFNLRNTLQPLSQTYRPSLHPLHHPNPFIKHILSNPYPTPLLCKPMPIWEYQLFSFKAAFNQGRHVFSKQTSSGAFGGRGASKLGYLSEAEEHIRRRTKLGRFESKKVEKESQEVKFSDLFLISVLKYGGVHGAERCFEESLVGMYAKDSVLEDVDKLFDELFELKFACSSTVSLYYCLDGQFEKTFDESFKLLVFEKLGVEEVQMMEWKALDERMEKWILALKIAFKFLSTV